MSIPTPKVRAPQGKSAPPEVSAAALLAGATKKGKTSNHLVYFGEGYHAFDLPDEPGDYDHRFRMLVGMGSLKIPGLITLRSYESHFAQVYATLPRSITEGVVFKRRASFYTNQRRASAETRDWLKRRFAWD